ncbi:hypothetical protein H8356DRAFT_999576 [Neocallimastix lanati (nom. inval.)]|jgi:hypothetical protein|nr:hypothetical protein H8356DRAFT_999576 [Neocallimastix sp. JGI-2020a]
MYLHEPGEEIESKEELLSKTQVLTSQSSLSHVKEVKQPVPPKAIRTTIYREKDETSALPASANWGSRNGKTRHDDGEKKVISINLSDLLSKTNENSKVNSINLSRSKSDSHSSQKIKTESKTKLNPPIKSQSIINLTSFKNELNDENSHHEKISNNNRDEEYPALSTLLSKKNNHSKEGHSSSHSSLIMSPQSSHSKLISRNNSKETINNDETTSKTAVDENNLINNKDNDTVVNEETTENIPRTESPIPEKEEIEIISEEKSEIENDIKEASKKSILEEISKAYSYDQVSTNTNITSSPIKSATTISSSFNLFTKLSKNPSESSKEGKTKSTNSPPPGFESKMESKMLSPNISKSDLKANDNYLNLNQSITDLKISDDEIISDNSNHINEFKYNGPFDPFNEVLNNLMNVNTIMSDYYRHYPQGFGGFNEMYNNEFNGMNQMSSLINGSNFAQYQNHLNKKYFDQYYQNLNREQIQNNLKAMLPNINISPYSNGNENNPWSNQHSQNGFNDNLFNSYNSLATTLNGNNMFFNNINNNIDFIKQYQMTQMLNNMKKTQQMENNMSMSNNINMNNYQDFKSLPFKDSAIMAVKMGNVNNDNSNQDSKNMNSMNLFQNLNMKPNEIANNAGFSINPVSPINAFANLNQLNNINGMNDIANLNGINSLNNNINSVNQLHNVQQMSNFNDITAMNMNLVSPSLSSSIIPNFDTINKTNFKSMNEFNNEGLTGLTGSANTMYENDMNFFQKLSQINKDGRENENILSSLPDFWKSKTQDTGGGADEKSNLLINSILEQRFNEAEQKSILYSKKSQDGMINNKDNNKMTNMNESEINEELELELKSSIGANQKCVDLNDIPIDNNALKKVNAKKEILDILIKKNFSDSENLKENPESGTVEFLKAKENNILNEENQKNRHAARYLKSKENIISSEENHKDVLVEPLKSKENNISNVEKKQVINTLNNNKYFEDLDKIQEKENISNNVVNNTMTPKIKNKEKKGVIKSDTKKELSTINKKEILKSEPLIIKLEPKKMKKEEIKREVTKEEPFIIKFEEKKSRKEESMIINVSKNNSKDEKLNNKKEEKQVPEKVINVIKDERDNIVNQTNMFEVLPDVNPMDSNIDNINLEDAPINIQKIDNEQISTSNETIQTTNSSKKNKKKSKRKKKKASSNEENIDLINKELDLNEKKNKENELNNKGKGQGKKKKKSKKKNNDIELHILTVKDNKTQLMKETQLYRLPLTAIAKKLIPEDKGTTLGLKPVFPPDIEIEALCNVVVTKRSKKKKRDNISLPFFNTKIEHLKSELENEKIDFNYLKEINENMVIERNENSIMKEQKEIDILKNNMEVNMITSLKQIKRRALKNKTELKNSNNIDESIVENLNEDFIDEEDIDDIKDNLHISTEKIIDIKMANEIANQKLSELNKQIIEHNNSSQNSESQFFVFQALDALINTAEVYANALKKQIEEYERKNYNLEDSNTYSNNYKRKVKIYEAVLESIKDIREMGLSDYKTLEKLYFSDMKGEGNYEDNISNLLISVKYIMQELVLNVDGQEVLPQILTLNKNTNILLSRMNGNKFKDSVLEQYKKLFEEKQSNSQMIENHHNDNSSNINIKDNTTTQEDNNKHSNRTDTPLSPIPSSPVNPSIAIDKTEQDNINNDIPELIEPESLKLVNESIKNFLKDYKLDESNKQIKVKKSQHEQPSSSNIELKIEYENEEVKNKIEKLPKSNNELLNSTEDILLELILKSQENQELKKKLISNCLNFDVNLVKKLAESLKMKGKDNDKSIILKKTEAPKLRSKLRDNPNEKVEITIVDGEIVKNMTENSNNHEKIELKKKRG